MLYDKSPLLRRLRLLGVRVRHFSVACLLVLNLKFEFKERDDCSFDSPVALLGLLVLNSKRYDDLFVRHAGCFACLFHPSLKTLRVSIAIRLGVISVRIVA